jgi:Zn-dependent peptidase ImmA (M78 family)
MDAQRTIPAVRKKAISKLADDVSNLFSKGLMTSLEEIVGFENLHLYVDHYEDCFDGMLVYDDSEFHIHLNIDRNNTTGSSRGRYSLAHELGHYYINEHRIGLQTGMLEPHGSISDGTSTDLIELEADYFASCLLMPYQKIYYFDKVKKFSLEKISVIAESFQVSLMAAVIRYTEVCLHELMVVVSKNNKVEWYIQNEAFPKWPFKFKVHGTLPPTTVAGEFFTKTNSKFTGVEEINPDDWFYPFVNDYRADRKMNEQCFYSESFGYVFSLLWFL